MRLGNAIQDKILISVAFTSLRNRQTKFVRTIENDYCRDLKWNEMDQLFCLDQSNLCQSINSSLFEAIFFVTMSDQIKSSRVEFLLDFVQHFDKDEKVKFLGFNSKSKKYLTTNLTSLFFLYI